MIRSLEIPSPGPFPYPHTFNIDNVVLVVPFVHAKTKGVRVYTVDGETWDFELDERKINTVMVEWVRRLKNL